MKKRILGVLTIMLTGLLFLGVGVLTAADVPDKLNIEGKGYKKDKKGAVVLSHKKHSTDYKVACTECHHEYKDGKNVWKEGQAVKKCAACHDPLKKEGKAMKLQNAYHKNCKNCHKELVKKGKSDKAPFKKCNNCHAKKAK
ncbi:MAG: cytochrome c3 family protein [Deltaproteobacteria bacterium]|nr:cytochrome c3 family protein [Deltaproteobacteria bacterium]